jgi:fatty-acid peroxygenase
MQDIPGQTLFDSSLALLREGYQFIANRCQRYHSPVFASRLLLRRTLCMRGEMAAKLFYEQQTFIRSKTAPKALGSLFGIDRAQGKQASEYLLRRQLLLQTLDAQRVEQLVRLAEEQWLAALQRWEGQAHVVMLPEIETLLCKAVCRWAGVPLGDHEAAQRRQQLAAMVDGSGRIGWEQLAALRARRKACAWADKLIEAQRAGRLNAPADSVTALLGSCRDIDGELLSQRVAAAELLALLRQTVAVARFIVFAVLELHRHPEWQRRLAHDDQWLRPFAQEVRRFYALLPFIAARVRQDFEWQGYAFKAGTRVLLDLYGTNRDPVTWQQPDEFLPERFIAWQGGACSFIPSAGAAHRCPCEQLTIVLIESALRLFCRRMHYTVAQQDLSISTRRMPMPPASCLVLSEIAAARG